MPIYIFPAITDGFDLQGLFRSIKKAALPLPVNMLAHEGQIKLDFVAALTSPQQAQINVFISSPSPLKIYTLTCATEGKAFVVDDTAVPIVCPNGHAASNVVERNGGNIPLFRGKSPDGENWLILISNAGNLVLFCDYRGK